MEVTRGMYRHFKGGYSLVEDIVIHSETKEEYVLYTLLDGSMQRIIRPISDFTKKIDKEKYPNCNQKHRFERIDILENKEDINSKNKIQNISKLINIDNTDLLKGIYRHFKGDYYLVEDVVIDSETKELYVYYRALYGKLKNYNKDIDIRLDTTNFGFVLEISNATPAEEEYIAELLHLKRIDKNISYETMYHEHIKHYPNYSTMVDNIFKKNLGDYNA